MLAAVAPDGHYVVFCQARTDTDRDGSIHVAYGYHGDTYGDALAMYFAIGPSSDLAVTNHAPRGPLRWTLPTPR